MTLLYTSWLFGMMGTLACLISLTIQDELTKWLLVLAGWWLIGGSLVFLAISVRRYYRS